MIANPDFIRKGIAWRRLPQKPFGYNYDYARPNIVQRN
jgi:hypothetical protein